MWTPIVWIRWEWCGEPETLGGDWDNQVLVPFCCQAACVSLLFLDTVWVEWALAIAQRLLLRLPQVPGATITQLCLDQPSQL
jgi:hypothetical protein